MSEIVYVAWNGLNCPTCGRLSDLKETGRGLIFFDYTEWNCGRCGSLWAQNHSKSGFLFKVKEESARHS